MSNELVPFSLDAFEDAGLVTTDEQLAALDVTKTSPKYLPRIQLAAASSELVKNRKCMAGDWVIPNGEECTILGESIDVMPLAVRSKAVDMRDKQNGVITSYDPTSQVYQDIKKIDKFVYHGLSYLVLERKTAALYELYFGNASGRQESDKLKPFLARPDRQARVATISAKLIEGREFSWHAPVVVKCSEPITTGPDMESIRREKEKFLNPKEVEVVEAAEGSRPR